MKKKLTAADMHDPQVIAETPWFSMRKVGIDVAPGERRDFYSIHYPRPAVGIVAIQDEKVLLIRHYRYLIDKVVWAIPSGGVDEGEDPAVAALLRSQGFQDLRLLSADSEFAGVRLQKTTSGQHGSDRTYAVPAMAERLGEACGVVFRHPQEKTLWLVGDTIWRDDIAADLLKLRPDVVVLNAGYAHVIGFGPIIMGKEDLLNVHFTLPEAKIMAIHLEAVNHCLVSREEMRQYALDNQIADVVSIPQDGETVVY